MDQVNFTIQGIDDATKEEIVRDSSYGDDLFEFKVVDVFRRYLQVDNALPVPIAAQSLVDLLPEPEGPRGGSNELRTLWEFFLEIAQQIPHNHPFQHKLARCLFALRHSPKTTYKSHWDEFHKHEYVHEFAVLQETWREAWQPAFMAEDLEDTSTPDFQRGWINVNAFYANVHALECVNLSAICIGTMHEAFGSTPTTAYERLDCHVSAAAQWIKYASQRILKEILWPRESELEIAQAEGEWSLQLWRRWKAGFSHMAVEDNLKETTQELALQAADLMEALEKALAQGHEQDDHQPFMPV